MTDTETRAAFSEAHGLTFDARTADMIREYSDGSTYQAIAKLYGLSSQRVGDILRRAVARIARHRVWPEQPPVRSDGPRFTDAVIARFRPYFPAPAPFDVKEAARGALGTARRKGELTVPDRCSLCECGPIKPRHMHGHHRDYTAPLTVDWLCDGCHRRLHSVETFVRSQVDIR